MQTIWVSTTVGQVALTTLSVLAGAFLRKGTAGGSTGHVGTKPCFIDCASLETWFIYTQRQYIQLSRIPEVSNMLSTVSGL